MNASSFTMQVIKTIFDEQFLFRINVHIFSNFCHLDWSDFTLDLPVHLTSWFSSIMFCHFSNFQFLYSFLAAIIHYLPKVLEYVILYPKQNFHITKDDLKNQNLELLRAFGFSKPLCRCHFLPYSQLPRGAEPIIFLYKTTGRLREVRPLDQGHTARILSATTTLFLTSSLPTTLSLSSEYMPPKVVKRERFEFLCIFLLGNLWEVFELFSLAVPI